MSQVTVVGGGIAGLVTAISVAEAGGRVSLHEASGQLGGRGRSQDGPHRTNVGPHALYRHGGFEAWLLERELLPPVVYPSLTGLRMRLGGRLRRMPLVLVKAMRTLSAQAPDGESYRAWATRLFGEEIAEAAIGLASLPTFHPDPGTLAASFVQERLQRSAAWRPVYYVRGGWSTLIDELAGRALALGVEIHTGSKLAALPEGPTVVATDLPAAARLLEDPSIRWPGAKSALLDVAIRSRRGDPTGVLDLDQRLYAANYASVDDSVAPRGEALIQAVAGVRDGESAEQAWSRIRTVLDAAYRGWTERVVWSRTGLVDGGAGAVDPPGTTWRDRPALDRGNGRWLVGDRTAAPGVLSEVAFESARRVAESIAEKVLGARAA